MATVSVLNKIKRYYDKGIYKKTHMRIFVEKHVIDEEEYASITGEAYEVPIEEPITQP